MKARVPSIQWRIMVRLLPLLALIFVGVVLFHFRAAAREN